MLFLRLVIIAVLVHVVIFGLFMIRFEQDHKEPAVELFFWGSILRPGELADPVRSSTPKWDVPDVPGTGPELLSKQPHWDRMIRSDKPEMVRAYRAKVDEQIKFTGPRVEITEEDVGSVDVVADMPAMPRVRLRYPE